MTAVELHLTGLTHGAEAVGRLPSGKVCFVAHAIPGERVLVDVVEERSKWARGRLVEVLEASPDRVDPPCPYAGPETPEHPVRCGGCLLQHVRSDRQPGMKRRILVEQLQRIGRFDDPPVGEPVAVAPLGYRSHARFAVDGQGRLGFRRLRSHDVAAVDRCLLLDEPTQRLRAAAGDDWRGVEEVTVRTSHRGHRVLVVSPGPGGLPPLPDGDAAVAVVGAGVPVDLRGDSRLVEVVAGFPFEVSATSFFQPGRLGAEALVRLVREHAELHPGELVLDAYAGVGLFARVLAADGGEVTAVESHAGAAEDAQRNLDGHATVVREDVERFARAAAQEGRRYDLVVVDPPRQGLGPASRDLARLVGRRLVYVSCDPAALARDARALVDAGLRLTAVTPIDQFAQTPAVEAVGRFDR